VDHHAAVAQRPVGCARDLLAREAILDAQAVAGELALVEQVPEAVLELLVAVVGDLQDAVLDAEGVGEVVAELVAGDLRLPAAEVPAVEDRDPVLLFRGLARPLLLLLHRGEREHPQQDGEPHGRECSAGRRRNVFMR